MNGARALLGLLRGAYAAWVLERRTLLAAALAYFGFFSLAPLIYMAFAVAGVFIDTSSTAERMYALLGGFLGADAAGTVQGMVLAVCITQRRWSSVGNRGQHPGRSLGCLRVVRQSAECA